MSNIAWGRQICLATPHYRATVSGMEDYVWMPREDSGLQHCALKACLSLQFNLPHLCGLGGDAMVIECVDDRISVINGTGKTGRYQSAASYAAKGMDFVPRRGIYSTMVYGAPYAFEQLVQQRQLNLRRIVNSLQVGDFGRELMVSPAMQEIFQKAAGELGRSTSLQEWQCLLDQSQCTHIRFASMMQLIAMRGFNDLYTGDLAQLTLHHLAQFDDELYDEADFREFEPNPSEVKSMQFLDATIYCHGANSPWRELFLLLKIYELMQTCVRPLSARSLCDLAGHTEQEAALLLGSNAEITAQIAHKAQALLDSACAAALAPRDMLHRQSQTVFVAGVSEGGDLIGLSNSISTPLGALFEVENTGILLSNRCFAFNECAPYRPFQARSAVQHSNNCVIVDHPALRFVIGTSGGPVQSQTLVAVINAIVAEKKSAREAVHAFRVANMGKHPRSGKIIYLSERPDCDAPFQTTNGLSDKLGVVQLAGIDKHNGRLFAVADPRGSGIALGY